MSFILEALRRADRDRRSGDRPALQTVVEAAPSRPPHRRSTWPAAVAIAAVLVLITIALLLLVRDARKTSGPASAMMAASIASFLALRTWASMP